MKVKVIAASTVTKCLECDYMRLDPFAGTAAAEQHTEETCHQVFILSQKFALFTKRKPKPDTD